MHLDIYTRNGYQQPSRIQQPNKKGNYKAKGNKERSSGETTNTEDMPKGGRNTDSPEEPGDST